MSDQPPSFDEFVFIELLGHRRAAGRLREVTLAGAGFLRLDEPDGRTQFIAPGSVYAIHPTTEEAVRAVAAEWRTEPVSRYELPAAPPAPEHVCAAESPVLHSLDELGAPERVEGLPYGAGDYAAAYDYDDEGSF